MSPARETNDISPLWGHAPTRLITAARGVRNVTKTCAPRKTTSPSTRIASPMAQASPKSPLTVCAARCPAGAVEAMARPEARSRTSRRESTAGNTSALAAIASSVITGASLPPARPQTARTTEHSGERENSMNRRFALALSGLLFASVPAAAQDWPAKTVRIIVPFGPGSTPDMVGRLIADHMQQKLGQPFVIENRPGASANTGTEMVAKADPDGYTIGISLGGQLAINTLLSAKVLYDPDKHPALITMLTTQPSALVVHTSLGVNSVAELVDLLRKNPGKYNYGSIGNGSLSHLAMEALALKSGTTMVHVPYPGSPQAMTAVLRNDVQMACLPAISVTPHVASGQVKILAISLGRRSALMPGIPTLKESGVDVEADAWNGLIAPAKTPDAIIAKVHSAAVETLAEPAVREKLATQLMEPIPTTPAQFRAKIDADLARWSPVIKALNLKIN